jgi:hypothetical protein
MSAQPRIRMRKSDLNDVKTEQLAVYKPVGEIVIHCFLAVILCTTGVG